MNGRVLVAAFVGSVLAAVSVPVPVAAAAVVPCPTVKLSPPPQRPPKPKPPALDPTNARVGGDALATTGLAVPSGTPAPPKLTASTWLVADLDTGQVLGACNAHGYETPASVQKVLLSATMIPKLDPKQVVQVTREDVSIERGSSAVGLLEGGKYPIETLWYGLLFDSGNDAANVLARVGGGDKGRAGGVAMMNAEARHLGALQTHAVTPSGLDGTGQFTSAYDLVLIARAAFAMQDFRKYVATRTAKIPPQPPKDTRGFQIQNDNALLLTYKGALGGKSGFTTLARHSFVGAAKHGNRTLVAAVLGAEPRPIRASEQTAALLDWGFAQPADASVGRLVEPGELDPKPTPTADRPGAAEDAAARPSNGVPGASSAAVIGMTVAVVAVVLVTLLAARRRRAVVRARRAALAERRAAARGPDPRARPGGGGLDGAWDSGGVRGRPPRPGGDAPSEAPYRPPTAGRGAPAPHGARGEGGFPPGRGEGSFRPARAESGYPARWGESGYPPGHGESGFPAGRGDAYPTGRQRPADPYPPPQRRPPTQRRPPDDARYTSPRGGRHASGEPDAGSFTDHDPRYAPGDRRPRHGHAAPDPYRPPHPDDGWR